jgi:hypothetical protein
MSAVCILAPAVVAGWPAISAAVAGAAAAMGISVAQEAAAGATRIAARHSVSATEANAVELSAEGSEIVQEGLATSQEIRLQGEGVELRVYRDGSGRCTVSAMGVGKTDAELRVCGERFLQKLVQMYVYNRTMTELKSRGYEVIAEAVSEDETVHVRVRRAAG